MRLRARLTATCLVAVLGLVGAACNGDTEDVDNGPVDVDTQTDVGDDTGTTGGTDVGT